MAARKFQIGDLIGEYKDLGSSVMTIDSTGDLILLASKRVLQFINLSSPKHPHRIPRKNVKWEVNAAQWNPHKTDSTVFVVTRNNQADVCNFTNGKVEVKSTLQSHTRSITDLDWSPSSSNLLLTCSSDSNALLWDTRMCSLNGSKPTQTFETMQSCSASQVKWNKLEEHIFATSQDRDIRVWDTRKTDRPVYISGHLKKIHGLDWSSHNSKLLASASEDGSVKFWDYTVNAPNNNIGGFTSNTSRSPVWKARFAPFENSLLTIDVSPLRREGDNSLLLWDIEDINQPVLKFTFVGHSDVVTEFQWRKSPTANQYQLVTWSRDLTLRLCKYETSGTNTPKVIDIMERQSETSSLANGSPPDFDPGPAENGHKDGVSTPEPNLPAVLLSTREDEDEDDESSQDESIILSKSPTPYTSSAGMRSHQPQSSDSSPTLSTRVAARPAARDDLTLPLLPTLTENPPTSGDNTYYDEDDDDDDEAIPTSPHPYASTLQNEFRFLSTISNVTVRFNKEKRKSVVAISNVGEHTINLIISFPDTYPEESPEFRFDSSTTIEESLQGKLIDELNEAASPLIASNKACVEKCIHKLKYAVEDLNAKKSLDADPRLHSGYANTLSLQKYNSNIPYPRTCGAHFCNDRLITFQRPVHPAQSTPRTMGDTHTPHTPHNPRTRSNFFSPQLSRSPKDSFFMKPRSSRYHRPIKKEKSGPINVYDISALLPVNKSMAVEYRLEPTAENCKHNAEVAVSHGRRDLHQIWKLIEEFLDKRLDANPDDIQCGVPWAYLPMGRRMIESIMKHYSTLGDFQTLSLLTCMFPYEVPSLPTSAEIERPLQFNLQRSSSNMKLLGTSPATSLSGRSPPEKGYLMIDQTSTDSISNGWSTTSRRRADSHNGSLHDVRNPYTYPNEPETDIQRHKAAIQILDPSNGLLYDFYKSQYGEILYRWGLLDERLNLLKTAAAQPDQELSALSLTCGECNEAYKGSWCIYCKRNKLSCVLCRSGVKGPAALCLSCGHGGHTEHMRLWFETEKECPSGCGCHCLTQNTVER